MGLVEHNDSVVQIHSQSRSDLKNVDLIAGLRMEEYGTSRMSALSAIFLVA